MLKVLHMLSAGSVYGFHLTHCFIPALTQHPRANVRAHTTQDSSLKPTAEVWLLPVKGVQGLRAFL